MKKFLFVLFTSIVMCACSKSADVNTPKPDNDRDLSCIEGFNNDFPNATNVSWEVINGYNVVKFNLPAEPVVRSEESTYEAEAFYPVNNVNFLTQEYIPVSMVPKDCIDKVKFKLAADHDETVNCIEAIKATCNGTTVYKVLFERPDVPGVKIRPCYIYCNGKLVDFWEYDENDMLAPIEMPAIELMKYTEANYDNYCLTFSSYDNSDASETYLPLYFTDKNYASEIIFYDGDTDKVDELHVHIYPAIDVYSKVLPNTIPASTKTAINNYINTNLSDELGDNWVFSGMGELVSNGVSNYELEIKTGEMSYIVLSIDKNNVVSNL